MPIPATVIIVTKNEGRNIANCLRSLGQEFDDVLVVDSESTDDTKKMAAMLGAKTYDFVWNKQYPKKRQWILDNIPMKYDWVLFLDADERMTPLLIKEIEQTLRTDPENATGFFIRGQYYHHNKILRYGLQNNKIALLHKHRMMFPVIDDLHLNGMGEIEGHYQPVVKDGHTNFRIKSLKHPLLHLALGDDAAWEKRHKRYAQWERGMNKHALWPEDPVRLRQILKQIFRNIPMRPHIAFLHCYIIKTGFLDGRAGLDWARKRYRYYKLIRKNPEQV